MVDEKTEQKIEAKVEEIQKITQQVKQTTDINELKKLNERLAKVEQDLAEISIAWKGLKEQSAKEDEQKRINQEVRLRRHFKAD